MNEQKIKEGKPKRGLIVSLVVAINIVTIIFGAVTVGFALSGDGGVYAAVLAALTLLWVPLLISAFFEFLQETVGIDGWSTRKVRNYACLLLGPPFLILVALFLIATPADIIAKPG